MTNTTVKITSETLQLLANKTLQFFEITLNEIGNKITEEYHKNNLNTSTLEIILYQYGITCTCERIPYYHDELFLILSKDDFNKNNTIQTTTLFSTSENDGFYIDEEM